MSTPPLEHETLLLTLNYISTVPSLLGTLFMCYSSFKSRQANAAIKLILALGISDFFFSVSNLMSGFKPTEGDVACDIEGIMRDFFSKLSVCIATSIGLLHYKISVVGPNFHRGRLVFICLVSSIIVSFVFASRYTIIFKVLLTYLVIFMQVACLQ